MNEVQIDAVERRAVIGQLVQRLFPPAPVIAVAPVGGQLSYIREVRPLAPAGRGRRLVRPPGAGQPRLQVTQILVGKVDFQRFRHRGHHAKPHRRCCLSKDRRPGPAGSPHGDPGFPAVDRTLSSITPTEAAFAPTRDRGSYAWYVLFLLTFAYTVAFIDRQVLNLLVEDIKRDLLLTDTQLSLLQGLAFMGSYIVFSPWFGRWADVGNRRNILVFGVGTWSIFSALCGFAENYWQALPGASRRRRGGSVSRSSGVVIDCGLLQSRTPAQGDEHLFDGTVHRRRLGDDCRRHGDRIDGRHCARLAPVLVQHGAVATHVCHDRFSRRAARTRLAHDSRAGAWCAGRWHSRPQLLDAAK